MANKRTCGFSKNDYDQMIGVSHLKPSRKQSCATFRKNFIRQLGFMRSYEIMFDTELVKDAFGGIWEARSAEEAVGKFYAYSEAKYGKNPQGIKNVRATLFTRG